MYSIIMTEEKQKTINKLLTVVVLLAVGFSFTTGFILGGSGTTTTEVREVQQPTPQAPQAPQQPTQPTQPAAPSRVQVSADDDHVLGNEDAEVTIIEFSDFECPFCGRFYEQTLVQIKADYVDTGKVKFVYRDFPLQFHPQATPAAIAAECAGDQDKYFEYHDKIFENQQSLNTENYKAWAEELGLDTASFNSCLDSQKYAQEVADDMQDGVEAGVSGTPTLFIGSPEKGYTKIVGAQPYSAIKPVIDAELSN